MSNDWRSIDLSHCDTMRVLKWVKGHEMHAYFGTLFD